MLTLITKIMLSELQSQVDRDFFAILTQFQNWFTSATVETGLWWDDWQQLQQFYDREIMGAIANSTDDRERSIRIEIHRGIKLLEMDLLFLRSAKQKTTKQQRIKTIVSRLEQLSRYLQVLCY
jgi:hypothetical protein